MLHDIRQFNSINVKSRLFKIFLHPRLSFISNSFYFFNYRYKYTEITRKNSVLLTNQKSKIFIYNYYYYYYFLFLISSTHEHTTTMESGYKLGLLRIFRGKNYEEKSVFQNCILPLPLFVSFVRAARLSRALSHSFHSFSTTDCFRKTRSACLPATSAPRSPHEQFWRLSKPPSDQGPGEIN